MNIFILDYNQELAAEYHVDKHLNSQIKESAQILSTVCRLNGVQRGYKATHEHHPCVKWAGASKENFLWLVSFTFCLNKEWQYRFRHTRNHFSFDLICKLPIPNLPSIGITNFAQAMPEECRDPHSPVDAYRNYYRTHKRHLWKWSRRPMPWWLQETINE